MRLALGDWLPMIAAEFHPIKTQSYFKE